MTHRTMSGRSTTELHLVSIDKNTSINFFRYNNQFHLFFIKTNQISSCPSENHLCQEIHHFVFN